MMLFYLWGHCFKSSSDDLRRRSTKDFPKDSFEARGGGFSSITQILFLANPCWSSDPQSPNFNHTHKQSQLKCFKKKRKDTTMRALKLPEDSKSGSLHALILGVWRWPRQVYIVKNQIFMLLSLMGLVYNHIPCC